MYNDGAHSEKTPLAELKHFLPRYLELVSQFDFPSHSAEIALKRLKSLNQTAWSEGELNLLTAFASDYFRYCLSMYPLEGGERIDSILIML